MPNKIKLILMLTLKRRASNKGHLILILWPVGMINPRATTKVFYIDIDIDIGIDIDNVT